MSQEHSTTLSRKTRLAYGFGLSAEGIKNNAFNYFLLFYYQQIAGLDPLLCGAALFIALCFDAITDPAVGVWSDGMRSRFGRRHPFMFASSLPLALCFLGTFMPPKGLSQPLLFMWLLCFVCGTRFAMTLFMIPHASLVAELTTHYDERTRLQSLRTVFAWVFGLVNAVLAFRVFLKPTETYAVGLMNPDGYVSFAIFGALVMLLTTFVSSVGTLKQAVAVQPETSRVETGSLAGLPRQVRQALSNHNYRVVVGMGLFGAMSFGVVENLGNYVNTFFWGFTTQQLSVFVFVIFLAAMAVLFTVARLSQRFGKRNLAIAGSVLATINQPLMVGLKLLGVLPPDGSQALLTSICCAVFVSYYGVIVSMVMVGSMIADITDEFELSTGKRQEGLMFSALTLIAKASTGLGVLLASVIVKLVGFPEGAQPGQLDPAIPTRLAIFLAFSVLALGVSTVLIARGYRLDRATHTKIMDQLQARRAASRPSGLVA